MEFILNKMALPDKIAKGVKIRNQMGGHFSEMKALRQAIWATYVLGNPTEFTEEEVAKATAIKDAMLAKHNEIEAM